MNILMHYADSTILGGTSSRWVSWLTIDDLRVALYNIPPWAWGFKKKKGEESSQSCTLTYIPVPDVTDPTHPLFVRLCSVLARI